MDPMAHIVVDARIISTTTGRYVERLLHYLDTIDTENRYTVLVQTKDLDYWRPTNPNFALKTADFAPYSFGEQTGFLKLVNKLDADLVHFTSPHQPVLYRGKKVTTIHDLTLLKTYNSDKNWLVFHLKQLVGRFVFRHVAKTSRRIIVPTDFTKHELTERYRIDNITRTYLAAETKTTSQKPYDLPSDTFIMYVGQQSDYKNIRRLGDAHQKLLARFPDLHLVLVGKIDASAERNQRYFTGKKYRNIVFTGFVEDDELNWLYAHTSAYLFPSLMEGFGLPGLEAMTHGAPVVSSDATCLPEVYGDAAAYFDPNDTEAMTKRIAEVLDDAALRKRLVKNGYERLKDFCWRRTAEQTLEVYRDALKD